MLDHESLLCKNASCDDSNHIDSINNLYNSLVAALQKSSEFLYRDSKLQMYLTNR